MCETSKGHINSATLFSCHQGGPMRVRSGRTCSSGADVSFSAAGRPLPRMHVCWPPSPPRWTGISYLSAGNHMSRVFVCVCAWMCVLFVCVCVFACDILPCRYVGLCACLSACMCACMYLCMRARMHMRVHVCVCVCVCVMAVHERVWMALITGAMATSVTVFSICLCLPR